MTSYICIGKGKTDANGVAQLTHDCQGNVLQSPGYVGQGKGKLNVVASTDSPSSIGESSLQSEPYPVYDCILRDGGTSSDKNDAMWIVARGTLERGSESTEIKLNSGRTDTLVYFYLSNTDSFVIEFDAIFDCSVEGAFEIQFRNNDWGVLNGGIRVGNYPSDTWTHFKLQIKDGKFTRWIGNNQLTPVSISDIVMFCFQVLSDDDYFKFKNFEYYPI